MTNAQLIEELQRYPGHVPVRVLLSEVYGIGDGEHNDEAPPVMLCPEDAIEADRVIFEGSHILIESK